MLLEQEGRKSQLTIIVYSFRQYSLLLLVGEEGDYREQLPLDVLPSGECTSFSCSQIGRVSRSQRVISMKMSANSRRCLVHWLLSLGYVGDNNQRRSKKAKIFTCCKRTEICVGIRLWSFVSKTRVIRILHLVISPYTSYNNITMWKWAQG